MKKGYTIQSDNIIVNHFFSDVESCCLIDNCQDRYEIVYSISSLGSCTVEGCEYQLDPRSILVIPPFSFHTHSLPDVECAQGFSISFLKSAISDKVSTMLDKISPPEENSGRFYSPSSVSDAISDVFRRFEDAISLPDQEKNAFLEMLVSEVIILLSASDGKSVSHFENELGAKVARYLNANIEKNISLDRLANRFFVSKYHLCRAFKKYSGTSVHSYMNYKRILYAKQLIESGETASAVAERVGFGDYSDFYRAYVKIVGNSPTKELK